MLTKDTLYLIALCQTFLENKISAKVFCQEFERFYCDDATTVFSDDENVIWSGLMYYIALYQPSAEIREDEPSLIDENQLKQEVQKTLKELAELG